jgi:peptide/nickel transport system permease protein
VAPRPSLFRQEAIDFVHQHRSWGEVALLQPISTKLLSWSLATVVALILVFLSIAQYSRFMRASMLEVVNSDYVRTARAKGLPEQKVTFKHALRNALIPVVTVSALNFGALIGGAVITEEIFELDGMGPYFLENLLSQDVYPVMAWLMVTAIAIVVFNLVADVIYGWLDPRISYG